MLEKTIHGHAPWKDHESVDGQPIPTFAHKLPLPTSKLGSRPTEQPPLWISMSCNFPSSKSWGSHRSCSHLGTSSYLHQNFYGRERHQSALLSKPAPGWWYLQPFCRRNKGLHQHDLGGVWFPWAFSEITSKEWRLGVLLSGNMQTAILLDEQGASSAWSQRSPKIGDSLVRDSHWIRTMLQMRSLVKLQGVIWLHL